MKLDGRPDPITLGKLIKQQRESLGLLQDDLAGLVGVDARSVRGWESGSVKTIHWEYRSKLHEVLGISRHVLGLDNQITIEEAWDLQEQTNLYFEQGNYIAAKANSDWLSVEYQKARASHFREMRLILPQVYQSLGLAEAVLSDRPESTMHFYKNWQRAAKELNDLNGQVLAISFQGDTLRRAGNYTAAQSFLEEVWERFKDNPSSGISDRAAGNGLQFLARVRLEQEEGKQTYELLRRADEYAHRLMPFAARDYYICFGLLSVKQQLAKLFMLSGKYPKGFKALEEAKLLAKKAGPRWAIPEQMKEGELIMRVGRDSEDASLIKEGRTILLQGYQLAEKYHHLRQQNQARRLLNTWRKSAGSWEECIDELEEDFNKIDGKGGPERNF